MQEWLPSTTRIDPGQGDELVMAALAGMLAAPLRVVPAWGSASAPREATVTGSTRLVCVLAGRNRMRWPQGTTVVERCLRPGACVAIHRQAWNQPLHIHANEFLTVDVGRQRIRFYRRRRDGRGGCEHAASWVMRPPTEATLRLAAATEALLPETGDEAVVLRRELASALLRQCRRELARPASAADALWLQLSEWLRERLHRPVSRSEAASAVGVHPNHLSRLFARHAGLGFAAWMAARRIELAEELLLGGAAPSAVAMRCGFSSPSYFNAVFSRATGCSPGRWAAARS